MICSFKIPTVKVARLSFTSGFYIDLYLFKNAFSNKFLSSIISKTIVYNIKNDRDF